jgi:hypothetical protein
LASASSQIDRNPIHISDPMAAMISTAIAVSHL